MNPPEPLTGPPPRSLAVAWAKVVEMRDNPITTAEFNWLIDQVKAATLRGDAMAGFLQALATAYGKGFIDGKSAIREPAITRQTQEMPQ